MPDFIIHHGEKKEKKEKKDSANEESNPDHEATVQVSAALDNWYLISKYLWTRRSWWHGQQVSRGRNHMQHRISTQEDKTHRRHHERQEEL